MSAFMNGFCLLCVCVYNPAPKHVPAHVCLCVKVSPACAQRVVLLLGKVLFSPFPCWPRTHAIRTKQPAGYVSVLAPAARFKGDDNASS